MTDISLLQKRTSLILSHSPGVGTEVPPSLSSKDAFVRVNGLRTSYEDMWNYLSEKGYAPRQVEGVAGIFQVRESISLLRDDEAIAQGKLYIQNPSSLLPVVALEPKPNDRVLDLCAAPGGKSAFVAERMQNAGELVCVDVSRDRLYRLKANFLRLNVLNAQVICKDGRFFRQQKPLFDRILVDAPCSCESLIDFQDAKTYKHWSIRKIKEMSHKQKGLLLNASRLLRKGGTLVYSTCTLAPEENEEVVDYVLHKNSNLELQPISWPVIPIYPALQEWEGDSYDASIQKCLRILPTQTFEAFFIAKFVLSSSS